MYAQLFKLLGIASGGYVEAPVQNYGTFGTDEIAVLCIFAVIVGYMSVTRYLRGTLY